MEYVTSVSQQLTLKHNLFYTSLPGHCENKNGKKFQFFFTALDMQRDSLVFKDSGCTSDAYARCGLTAFCFLTCPGTLRKHAQKRSPQPSRSSLPRQIGLGLLLERNTNEGNVTRIKEVVSGLGAHKSSKVRVRLRKSSCEIGGCVGGSVPFSLTIFHPCSGWNSKFAGCD